MLKHPGSTSEAASAVGRGNTKTDTKPEVIVRSHLHRLGLRFRKNYYIRLDDGKRGVRPDIVFTKRKVAVFIDGCFWHMCPVHGMIPRSNEAYWRPKLEGNVRRDEKSTRRLEAAGWEVLRFWEHEDPTSVARLVQELMES